MAYDVGELVATIKAAGFQALEAGLTSAETRFRSTGRTAQSSMTAVENSAKGATAAVKSQGDAAATAGTKGAAAARSQKAATDASAASTQKQAGASRTAGSAAQDAGAKGAKAGADTAAGADKASDRLQKQAAAARTVGESITAVGAAALAAFTGAAVTSAGFDQRMAQLQTLGKYGSQSMDQARQAALTAGTQYGLTADQVADAQIELQKAGTGLTDQLGGALPGALTLAASGQLDVADATSIAVTAMTQFHLAADQTSHVADLLAAGSDKALGSVGDLGMALKQGGLVASQYGWSLEETTGVLSAFAQAGLVGSDAGTSLKTALLQLATPTQQQAALMKQYNLQLYDSQGHFVSAANLAGQLQSSFQGVDDQSRNMALGVLFGSDAVRAANILFDQGKSGIQDWTSKVNEAGFAAQQAGGKQNSLAGDATKLSAAFQNDLIRAGEAVTPVLRGITQGASALLGVVGDIPQPILAAGVALTAIGGAAAVGGGGLLVLAPRILDTVNAVQQLRPVVAKAAASDIPVLSRSLRAGGAAAGVFGRGVGAAASILTGPWGLAIAAGGLALTAWQTAVDNAKASTDTLDAAASRGADGVSKLVAAAAQGQNASKGIFAWLESGGIFGGNGDVETGVLDDLSAKLERIQDLTANPLKGFFEGDNRLGATRDTIEQIGKTLADVSNTDAPKAAQAFEALGQQYHLNADGMQRLLQFMPEYGKALETEATAQGRLTGKETDSQKSKILLAQATRDAKTAGDDQASTAAAQASAIGQIQGSAAAASESVSQLATDIKGLGSATLDARSAQRDLEQAVDDAATQFGKGSHSLDISTQAGRDNQAAMDKIAQAATNAAAATYAQTGSIDAATASMKDSRKQFIDSVAPILGSRDAARKLADQLDLIPKDVEVLVKARTGDAADDIAALAAKVNAVPRYFLIHPEVTAPTGSAGSGDGSFLLKKAGGGAIRGGRAGIDSVPIMAMPDEHMWTRTEVRAAGGHQAVQRIRTAALAGTLGGYASGGAIGEAATARQKAQDQITRLAAQITRQQKAVKRARTESNTADKAYKRAQDAQAAIYGKGTADAKHQAVLDTREAKKAADAAAKDQKAAEDRLADLKKQKDTATQTKTDQTDRGTSLGQTVEDLGTSYSRGEYTDPSNPFSAVDLAFQQSRNSDLSASARKTLDTAAKSSNATMVKLAQQQKDATDAQAQATKDLSDAQDAQNKVLDDAKQKSDDATTALQTVQSAMQSLSSGIASTIRGFFSLGATLKDETSTVTSVSHNAGTAAQWDEKVSTVTAAGTTVGAIRSSVTQSANSMDAFQGQLQAMARMGYSAAVIQDTANLGVEQGSQIAAAFLQGTGDDVAAINSGYSRMTATSTSTGDFVSQAVYGDQLSAAQAAANYAAQQVQIQQDTLTAITAKGQAAIDAANANAASINLSIQQAQQSMVDAVSRALSGSVTKKADGGYREASMAPAGANILWAEQETGGESYIPHAASKRARSQQILQATARKFGMVVLPMADGGMFAGGSSTSSTDARTISGDHFDFSGGTWLGTPDAVLAQAERRAAAKRARAVNTAGLRRVNP